MSAVEVGWHQRNFRPGYFRNPNLICPTHIAMEKPASVLSLTLTGPRNDGSRNH